MKLFMVFRILSNISSLVLCFVGLRSFKNGALGYARIFALLNIFEQIAEVILWGTVAGTILQASVNNAVVLAEMIIYSFIFFEIIYSKTVRWILVSLMSLIIIRFVVVLLHKGFGYMFPLDLQVYSYFIFLIPSFTYFREIFRFRKEVDLLRDFTFWLVAGLMFYFAACIIFQLGLNYLAMINAQHHYEDFYVFSGIVYMISNIIFIKAFLCLPNWSYR
jgi:hypothetical protein